MKTFNKKLIATILSAMMLFTACSKTESEDTRETNGTGKTDTTINENYNYLQENTGNPEVLTNDYNNYSFNLISNIIENQGDDTNIMVSPASVMFALDLCAVGANGNTLTELTNLFSPGTDSQTQQAFASQSMANMNNAEGLDFSCANAIWGNSNLLGDNINQSYLDAVSNSFDATYTSTPFSSGTVNEINNWVDEHTNHMIDRVISDLSEDCTMVLVNAIAFESTWAVDYDDYQVVEDYPFNNANGSTSNVNMLIGEENTYFETELATGFMKYYEGYQYAFVVMLPTDESLSANEFLSSFSGADYQEFIESATNEYDVNTYMPEFISDYETSLTDVIQSMGVNDAFTENADFSGITDDSLFISDIIHKTHIDVNRTGTSAAAVTAVMIERCSITEEIPVEVICDRPYAYAIVDVNNGYTPIFVGTVNNL